MSLRIRSLVALLLLACFPLVVLALAGAIMVGGFLVADSASGYVGGKVIIVGVLVLAGLVSGATSAVRARPQPMEGPELTREAEPVLWELVDSLAARMGVQGPRRIVVDGDVNAAVTEVAGHREMVIGLPLLAGLNRSELVSVLAHELGHFAQGHTRLTRLTYRWNLLMGGVIERMNSRIVAWFLLLYYRLFLLFASSANREQELQADDWAARLADPASAASAMERVGQIAACWETLTENYLPLTGPARRRAPLTTGLRCLMQAHPVPAGALLNTAEERSVLDSHPPTAERVSRFRRLAAGAPPASPDPVPASALLCGAEATLDRLEQQLLEDDDPRAEWDEVVSLSGQAEAERITGVVAKTLATAGHPGPLTVDGLLTLFVQGHCGDLVLPLIRGGLSREELTEAVPEVGADVLAAAVHLSLAADGRARYALSWTGPRRWQLWYGEQGWQDVDLRAMVTDAARDPAKAAALQQTLRGWGARLDLPITPQDLAEAGAGPAGFWGHLLLNTPTVPGGRKPRGRARVVDVLIYPSGVLLVRPGRVWAFGLNAWHAYAKKAARRCDGLLTSVGPDPAAFAAAQGRAKDGGPVARWIPESALIGAQHTERAVRGDLYTITLRGGETVVLEHTEATISTEDPMAELTRICNYR